LIHDLDYERFPQEHCHKTEEILTERGWPAEYIRAVVSHGWGICTDVEPRSELEKVLYAIDELTPGWWRRPRWCGRAKVCSM